MKNISNEVLTEIIHIHKILANPSRVKILLLLSEGQQNVSQISDAIGLEQSAASHQLKILKVHQLVTQARDGKTINYQIGDSHILQLLKLSIAHAQELESDHIHDSQTSSYDA
ncbi:metalloregulator ArsR/SmtB family transcription factor [Pseudolactococcus yaeyamensis]